jgi:hypothetical protein
VSNSTKIVDQIFSVHTNTSIPDGQSVVFLVWYNLDLKFLLIFIDTLILQRNESNFIQGIRGIGDSFSQKHIFLCVEGVNNDVQKSTDLCLEDKVLFLWIVLSNLVVHSYIENVNCQ